MSARWAIVVGAVAITGGIAWFALRGHGDPTPDTAKSGDDPAAVTPGSAAGSGLIRKTRDGKAAIFAPAGPNLGSDSAAAEAPPTASPETAFESETRDDAWARRTEDEIKHRFRSLRGGSLDAAECKTDQCLLTLSGTEDQMAQTFAELETRRGLLGYAERVILTGPEQRDGKLVVKAYAMFTRDAVPGQN